MFIRKKQKEFICIAIIKINKELLDLFTTPIIIFLI